ncbi:MAG: uroporphyrinogen-III synthase [Bacteroidales bacterium]|jgi:uroporphyrinogen-III synthase|nr:uroporphyrinogen-III synthase [Bacteroidales bacterium]MBR3466975.1 uroporphyrinogen-III synthase [Bacteroidales bacterium]MBR4637231.1 uroporphyrinogen-III synthase [Bacteroidales bacterium]MBR6903271.1 uroporphyrinogen-III synthase [Bacteroidales bacterium]
MKIKNILISQNAPEDIERSPYGELIRKYSINIDFYKFFKINCTTAIEFRKTHINILEFESIVFSSTNTIDKFFELCKDMRLEMPESMKYYCATESIALYLQKYVPYRKRRVFAAKDAQVTSFYDLLVKNKTVSMLIPCGQDGISPQLEAVLAENEIKYAQAVVFKIEPADLAHDVDIDKYDLIVFFSPNGVKSLQANYPDFQQGEKAFAALGKAAEQAIAEAGWTLHVSAPSKQHASLTEALDAFLKEYANRRR